MEKIVFGEKNTDIFRNTKRGDQVTPVINYAEITEKQRLHLFGMERFPQKTHPSGSANGVNIPLVVRQIPVLLNFATVSDRVLSKRVLSKSAASPRFPSTLRLLCLFARIKQKEHTNSAFSYHLHAVFTIYTINYCYYIVIPFIPNLFHYLNLILS